MNDVSADCYWYGNCVPLSGGGAGGYYGGGPGGSFFGANGYRNSALFWSIHVNGQYGVQLSPNGPFTDIQAHIDLFNPSTGLLGILGHGIWDLGIGSLLFRHSSALDPGC
jgi:hypothetical protein